MNKIELIEQAIEDAINDRSKLTNEILELPSFCTAKIKHLLNNLGAMSNTYLEVGLHKSGTFIATLYGNDCVGIGFDNWSQFEQDGLSKQLAYENTSKYLKNGYQIIEMDCFEYVIPHSQKGMIDIYTYDGDHATESQKKGITHFIDFMKDEFIFCCDDASWEGPREGTKQAITELGLEVLFEKFLWDGKEGGEWHNGFHIYLLRK